MSIMAFEFPIMEMNFALSEFEFKVFTLEIDFHFRIFTFGNRFSLLMATLGHRSFITNIQFNDTVLLEDWRK